MFDIGKLVPKLPLPAFSFQYWDRFLGICFVVAALVQGVTPRSYALLLFGFCLLAFSMARERGHYIGAVRIADLSRQYKRTLAYPKVLAGMFWLIVSLVCFRYAALNFQITARWLRLILHY